MKLSELLRQLTKEGARFYRHGKRHDLWERNGKTVPVPRHAKEVASGTVKSILEALEINK